MTENHNTQGDFLKLLGSIGTFEGGSNTNNSSNAAAWLKNFKRIKGLANVDDKSALLIVGINLRGEAQEWWDEIEESVKDWCTFENKFKNKYTQNKIAETWGEIKQIKQKEDQEVGEFITILNSLFKRVGMNDDESKKSFFIASVNSSIV